jgi:cytochrome c biogenesis protein CcdA
MTQATPAQATDSTGRVCTILAFVLGAISILLIPIILGPIAIVLAYVGYKKGDPLARYALPFAIVAMILGFVLGFIVFAANDDDQNSLAVVAQVLAAQSWR